MEDGDLIAEVGAQPAGQDGRERDLGHEHHRAPAGSQSRVHRANVDFGLAAAGNSMQKHWAKGVAGYRRLNRLQDRALRAGQYQFLSLREFSPAQWIASSLSFKLP